MAACLGAGQRGAIVEALKDFPKSIKVYKGRNKGLYQGLFQVYEGLFKGI